MYQRPPYSSVAGRQQPVAITTPGMQNQFHTQPPGATSHTPTIPPKFPQLDSTRSLTPQMPHRRHIEPPSLPMSTLAISNLPLQSSNQPGHFPVPQSGHFPVPPSSQPGQFPVPPSSQPGQFAVPPPGQPGQFAVPQSGQFSVPQSTQPEQFVVPPPGQPGQFAVPQSGQFHVPQSGQFAVPQSGQFPVPQSGQPGQISVPQSTQPEQFVVPPPGQLGQFSVPPSNQSGQFGVPPSNQPGQFSVPQSGQPGQISVPPSNQTGQFGVPPSGQSGQFAVPLSGQTGQFGAPQLGQFPPVTSQPKVTPDSIPSVVEVLAAEKERWVSNEYLTGSRTPPPGTLIPCPIRDTGNASPRYLRSSLYTLPTSADMIKESKLVAGLIIQPLANDPDNPKLPLVDNGPSGPIRCKRCKAYMNPFNTFTGGGATYTCIFCGISNEVPNTYFQFCDASGQRMDAGDRSELSRGSYEQTVTRDYMRHQREGDPPALVLVVDVSMRSYNVGLEGFLSSHVSDLLERLPREDSGMCPLEIGLIVYDTQAYYFNLSAPLPLIYVITDTADPFLPEPAGSLVPVPQAVTGIRAVLERLPALFPQRKSGGCLGVGVRAGLSLLSEMRRVGKLLVFQVDIPEIPGPGQLKRRTDSFFKPQSAFYDKLSADCQRAGVCADLFLLPSAYTDVFTLGHLCHSTGGQLHYHYNFSASKPASYSRLLSDLQDSLSTQLGFDAVMRVRTSPGLSADQYQGAIRLSGSEIQMAGLDADKTVGVVLRYEDKLKEGSLVYVQVALLYTNMRGERRLRLHNLALCTSSHFEDVYLSADLDAMTHLLVRLNLRGFIEEPMESVSDRLRLQVAHILAVYRRHCNPASNTGQLILPSSLKLLPCYSSCILKLPVTPQPATPPNSPDLRAHSFYRLQWLSTREFMLLLYPRVYPVDATMSSLPDPIRASVTRIEAQGVYIATDGQQLVLSLGANTPSQLIAEVFGVSSVHQVDPSQSTLPKLDNATSRHLHEVLSSLQAWVGKSLPLCVSKQGDQSEQVFRSLLVEDGIPGRATYVDTTCMLHREIKKLLS